MADLPAQTFPTANACARYILYLGGRDGIDDVDQFKVQKTLYFCQCWSLAFRGRPLFEDIVQAWRYGPVVPAVYNELRHRGDEPIEACPPPSLRELSQDDRDFIDSVWHDCRKHSGKAMTNWTHQPGPWAETWGSRSEWDRSEEEIPVERMREFFTERARSWSHPR